MEKHAASCTFESDIFGGFTTHVNLESIQCVDEILIFAVSALYGLLELHHFDKLLAAAKQRNFFIKSIDGRTYWTKSTVFCGAINTLTPDINIKELHDKTIVISDITGLTL